MKMRRSAACLGLAWFGVLASSPSQAIRLANADAAVGQWDMSLDASDRTCRMTLEAGSSGGGSVDMPALCRRSLPILAKVGAWNLPKAGDIELADAAGKPVLDFVAGAAKALSASGPQGETYAFVPVNAPADVTFDPEDARRVPGFDVVQAAPAEPVQAQSQSHMTSAPAKKPPRSSAAALTMKPADVAARYSIERQGGKDADCLLILDDQTKAPGGYKATLAPGCRDQGIMIFDPVGWRLVGGRLVLTARRGYTTHLDLQPGGTWLKDASEGKTLILKKL
jgi:Protease inhibitor Inh